MTVAGYEISTDRSRLDRDLIHEFLANEPFGFRPLENPGRMMEISRPYGRND